MATHSNDMTKAAARWVWLRMLPAGALAMVAVALASFDVAASSGHSCVSTCQNQWIADGGQCVGRDQACLDVARAKYDACVVACTTPQRTTTTTPPRPTTTTTPVPAISPSTGACIKQATADKKICLVSASALECEAEYETAFASCFAPGKGVTCAASCLAKKTKCTSKTGGSSSRSTCVKGCQDQWGDAGARC